MIAVPARMAHLERDRRGYPIPAIVLRTSDGRPHFTINDDSKVLRAAQLNACGICGKRLHKSGGWFVGGPASAFHPQGAYLDGPVHHECGTFALETCPYLAAPKYAGRIDEGTLTDAQRAEVGVTVDTTMLPDRPDIFVFGRATQFTFARRGPASALMFHPRKPFVEIEYWQKSVQLPEAIAVPIVTRSLLASTGTIDHLTSTQ